MKANELKVTDIMVGDWVICYHPRRLKCFGKVSVGLLHTMQEQEYGHIKEDSPLFRIVEPIPITKELLEKNGFEREELELPHNYYSGIGDRVILNDNRDYMNSNNKWSVHVDDEDYCTIASCELTYLHELQQLLNLCKIDFEWRVN